MKVDYFQAQKIIQNKSFPFYIITGNDVFQYSDLIKIICNIYRLKNFEIIKEQVISDSNFFLNHNHKTVSLFSTKRLLQITFMQIPGKNIQNSLINIARSLHGDDHYLLVFNTVLSQAQQKSKWFEALLKNGLHINLRPFLMKDVFNILKLVIKRNKKIQVTDDAIMLIIGKTEGNLCAANNIISLLSTQPERTFDVNNIVNFLADFMHYDVFDLAQSITFQNYKRSFKILDYLLQQIEPAIILWVIIKEIRLWIVLSTYNSIEQQQIFKSKAIWGFKQSAYIKIVHKFGYQKLKNFMNKCLNIDLMIKGAINGNINQNLTALVGDLTLMHDHDN